MKVNTKGALFASLGFGSLLLAGCDMPMVLDPKGPQAEVQANDIMISIYIMSGIVLVVLALLVFMLVKYRASNQPADYEPPHIHGHWLVESIMIGVPIVIVAVLSVITVKGVYKVEAVPEKYEDQDPLVIYAQSSNWKWHFSYPEQDVETVNYLYIPTNRAIEFRLYSHGPITSFWIPQLGGQKYAMADMVTKLNLAADHEGEYFGRNSNFSGAGFAENTFLTTAMSEEDFNEWVEEVHATAKPITEEKYEELLEPGHLGTSTYTGTHLEFAPAPEHNHGVEERSDEGHNHE